MNDWQKGDLALCVSTTSRGTIKAGAILTVEDYRPSQQVEVMGLWFMGVRSAASSGGFHVYRFRKITPDKADKFDREVIEHMVGGKVDAA